ncbi:unnamed protein product [Danaus chrysippus]|uniref:(African queen) hypothetical protein n=1 Tax=Danaus chrysippus TaxID=151541 RepID=A0A8J2VZA6_9NEOP|nr:unnamed protein product [Danaus chrysippus]
MPSGRTGRGRGRAGPGATRRGLINIWLTMTVTDGPGSAISLVITDETHALFLYTQPGGRSSCMTLNG